MERADSIALAGDPPGEIFELLRLAYHLRLVIFHLWFVLPHPSLRSFSYHQDSIVETPGRASRNSLAP